MSECKDYDIADSACFHFTIFFLLFLFSSSSSAFARINQPKLLASRFMIPTCGLVVPERHQKRGLLCVFFFV